jgi:hypothetical protein
MGIEIKVKPALGCRAYMQNGFCRGKIFRVSEYARTRIFAQCSQEFSAFVSRLDPLIERLKYSRVHRGNHIYRRIKFFFRHPRFPCVRKAAVHSRVAKPHHCDGETDEHLLPFRQTFDRVRVAIESSEICFFHGFAPLLRGLASRVLRLEFSGQP